jgi:hypothetical protein
MDGSQLVLFLVRYEGTTSLSYNRLAGILCVADLRSVPISSSTGHAIPGTLLAHLSSFGIHCRLFEAAERTEIHFDLPFSTLDPVDPVLE